MKLRRPRKAPAAWNRNPCAETPYAIYELARYYLGLRQAMKVDPCLTRRELEIALQGEHRNQYHRVGDTLVGLFDCPDGQPRLMVIPAFSPLYLRSTGP